MPPNDYKVSNTLADYVMIPIGPLTTMTGYYSIAIVQSAYGNLTKTSARLLLIYTLSPIHSLTPILNIMF